MPWRGGLRGPGAHVLIVGLVLALFAALGADAEAGKRPKPVRVPYTVTIEFVGTHGLKAYLGNAVVESSDETAAWTGTSLPFALVRTRTARRPLYRIAPYGGTLPQITIPGLVAVKGQGFVVASGGCVASWTMSEGEDAAARARLSLLANRMRIRMAFEGSAIQHWAWNTCYPVSGDVPCESWCVPIPPEDAGSDAFWDSHGRLNTRKVRLGKAFTLKVIRDPVTDPSLSVATTTGAGATVYQQWTFDWALRFTPARR